MWHYLDIIHGFVFMQIWANREYALAPPARPKYTFSATHCQHNLVDLSIHSENKISTVKIADRKFLFFQHVKVKLLTFMTTKKNIEKLAQVRNTNIKFLWEQDIYLHYT